VAINCSLFAGEGDFASMTASLQATVDRDPDVKAVRVWRSDGSLLLEKTNSTPGQNPADSDRSTDMKVSVPIVDGRERWGTVQLHFRPLGGEGLRGLLLRPVTKLVLFLAISGFALFFIYMRSTLQYLDPSKVMPDRVRHMLDTFAEGLMVVDKGERIVHTNEAFTRLVGQHGDELRGRRVSDFPWLRTEGEGFHEYPWTQAVMTPTFETGLKLGLNVDGLGHRTFLVNTSSILDDQGQSCGALISLDDVTSLEASRSELRSMLDRLKQSRDEIRRQNYELEKMARIDPLTSCLNRRAFYADFESLWAIARRYNKPLSCIILDVDHFKKVNDRFGHSAGDHVLQVIAKTLRETMRDSDLVCRYGGEEFCALLPETDVEAACQAAERTRQAIERADCGEVSVTASLGVSALGQGATDPRELLDQADKALYVAKRRGRNRVMRWEEVRDEIQHQEPKRDDGASASDIEESVQVPFPAVSALMSALSFRDAATAEHCQRVADLCAMMSTGTMSPSDAYHLEIAALLHDIGKIGIADAILLKPGQLTEDEWKIMRAHDQIGVTIIQEAFGSDTLTELVRCHHAWYGGTPHNVSLPKGEAIPIGARILAIAEAYDAMVSRSVYRKSLRPEEALAELRACAGKQFDPKLVERFAAEVTARDQNRRGCPSMVSREMVTGIVGVTGNLARAVENQDLVASAAIARRLKSIATKHGATRLAELAGQVVGLSGEDVESIELTSTIGELLTLCQEIQRDCLDSRTRQETPAGETNDDLGNVTEQPVDVS
jgi:diguanylate cyclase (GGDEF)-like protein/PAS domain S-box-containing protein